jgi:hypothetical protein
VITVTVHLTQTEARCRCVRRMGGQVECTVTVISGDLVRQAISIAYTASLPMSGVLDLIT